MKVIIGSYRGPVLVDRALASLTRHLSGWTELVIVDDSGRRDWVTRYGGMEVEASDGRVIRPKVIALRRRGYNAAMRAVCREARDDRFMFWEEDFELLEPVDLAELDAVLDERPNLAQIALLRGPHFENEYLYGGLLNALEERLGKEFVDLQTEVMFDYDSTRAPSPFSVTPVLHTQRGTFTCNPAVWQAGVAAMGWPKGSWSEDRKRDELLAMDFRFGYLPGVRVRHDGERSGHGY